MRIIREGGSGSGNFGHKGRPGEVGGSSKENFDGYYDPEMVEGEAYTLDVPNAYLLAPDGKLWALGRGVEHADARTWQGPDPVVDGGYSEIRVYPNFTSIVSPEEINLSIGLYIANSNPNARYSLIRAIPKMGRVEADNVFTKVDKDTILNGLKITEGGRGSGNYGHGGRIGVRGGAQAGVLGPAQSGGNKGAVMPAHDQYLSAVMYQSAATLKNASQVTGQNYDGLLRQLSQMLTSTQPVGLPMIVRELMMVYQVLGRIPNRGVDDPLTKLKASLVYSVQNLVRTGRAGPDMLNPKNFVKDPFKRRAQYMGVNYQ